MVENKHRKTVATQLARVRDKDPLAAFDKLTEVVDLERRIWSDMPGCAEQFGRAPTPAPATRLKLPGTWEIQINSTGLSQSLLFAIQS